MGVRQQLVHTFDNRLKVMAAATQDDQDDKGKRPGSHKGLLSMYCIQNPTQ